MSSLTEININEQKSFDGHVFPLVLTPNEQIKTIDDTLKYMEDEENMKFILDRTVKHGAILFRGFPVESPSDFNDFVLTFGWDDLPYIGINGYLLLLFT
jgi:hypothetical protein